MCKKKAGEGTRSVNDAIKGVNPDTSEIVSMVVVLLLFAACIGCDLAFSLDFLFEERLAYLNCGLATSTLWYWFATFIYVQGAITAGWMFGCTKRQDKEELQSAMIRGTLALPTFFHIPANVICGVQFLLVTIGWISLIWTLKQAKVHPGSFQDECHMPLVRNGDLFFAIEINLTAATLVLGMVAVWKGALGIGSRLLGTNLHNYD